ncbi:hypothetical protein EMA8858_02299 [Emticicia aquatica]|jgi:hypothetical protein|uniref:DUF3108 domain-containing protein n=1 Tax=Emticicia aquatica TaxID=1681835 RepID=A0ABM9AQK4_9BACT|nr:hypothetical protein [Emticicia aquatica]CAH0996169.1 hypothetical protein EMA8858_02299 [Emticicia aquatica]
MKISIYILFFLTFLQNAIGQTFEEMRYLTDDNTIFTQYRQFFYKYYFLKEKDTLLVKLYTKPETIAPYELSWKLEPKSKLTFEQDYTAIHQLALTVKVGDYFGQASLLQYDYLNKERRSVRHEQTGLVEVCDDIWINPPKEAQFLITELNPFPEIREPLIKDNSWQRTTITSNIGGSEKWKLWQGNVEVTATYRIRNIQTIKTNVGYLKCFVIDANAQSLLGETRLVAYFNKEYGFVKLNYTNIDGSYLVMDIYSVKQY